VVLVGRLSTAAQERELPSGDVLTAFRVVVDRPPARRPPPEGVRTPTVDSVACVAWTASLRRTALALAPGDVVEVRGAVRQRFWRTGAGVGSRTEVEVSALQRLQRA
jgi:single-strand DNA-binding protein